MSSSEAAISVRGISKAYKIRHNVTDHVTLAEVALDRLRHPFRRAHVERIWALRDVSFDLECGAVLGLVGPNGAGKTTLLKILSRITHPTSGEARLWGRVGSLLEVGTGFHTELTGRENVYLNGAVLGMSRREIDAQFDAIVDFAGVEQFLDTPIKRFSSGMQVRLAFAVAAHLNSEILLLDEVLAVGDSDFQSKCLGKVTELARTGRTVVLVSHNPTTVRQFATSALLLRAGQVVLQGPADEVLEAYLSTHHRRPQTVDVRNAPRPTSEFGQRARLVRLTLDQCDGVLEHDADLSVTVEIESDEPLSRAWLACVVSTTDGIVVGTSFSPPTMALTANQHERFRVVLPQPGLAPGSYTLSIVLGAQLTASRYDDLAALGANFAAGGGDGLDALRDCLEFEVGSVIDAEGRVVNWDRNWGPSRMPPLVVSTAVADPVEEAGAAE